MDFLQQLFRRYLKRQSNQQEQELVNRWYDATGKFPHPAWMRRKHLEKKQQETWERMVANLGLQEVAMARTTPGLSVKMIVRFAAAAIVIGLGVWGMLQWLSSSATKKKDLYAETLVYNTGTGKRLYLRLEDGTEVWLNHASVLRVSKHVQQNKLREVWLQEGEAYFKVAKDPHRPFIVHVDSLHTQVLGTSFNIRAYRQLPQLQVAVAEGKVQVAIADKVLDTLTRNRQLTYARHTGGFITIDKEVVTENGWWNNRFVLDKADFEELALRITLKYGIAISSNNKRILQTAFTANFQQSASLEEVLQTLCTLYSTHYSIKNNIVTIH